MDLPSEVRGSLGDVGRSRVADSERLCDPTNSCLEDEIARASSWRSKRYGPNSPAWVPIAFTISWATRLHFRNLSGLDPIEALRYEWVNRCAGLLGDAPGNRKGCRSSHGSVKAVT